MAKVSNRRGKGIQFWRANWFASVLLVWVVFLLIGLGLGYLQTMKGRFGAAPSADRNSNQGGLTAPLGAVFSDAVLALDTDAKLAARVAKTGHVIVLSFFARGMPQAPSDGSLPAPGLTSEVDHLGNFCFTATRGQQPIEIIGTEAAGIAYLNQWPDVDGAVKQKLLVINYFGKVVPV